MASGAVCTHMWRHVLSHIPCEIGQDLYNAGMLLKYRMFTYIIFTLSMFFNRRSSMPESSFIVIVRLDRTLQNVLKDRIPYSDLIGGSSRGMTDLLKQGFSRLICTYLIELMFGMRRRRILAGLLRASRGANLPELPFLLKKRFGLCYNDRMRIIDNDKKLKSFLILLGRRASGVSDEIKKSVSDILAAVRKDGDKAVIEYTRCFDKHSLPLKIKQSEIEKAVRQVDNKLIKALEISAGRIYDFHSKQKEASWSITKDGITLGQIIRPINRAGLYIPGGKASYPSTALMNIIPAQVAGVREIAVCVPSPNGEINPCVMAALKILGISEAYRIGGAQAVGAMAYGTKTIRRVDKIAGPGNIYVALAKKMVFGEVAIDMIAGPSEILIIADETAAPEFVAADMLSQAEHDEHASSIVIATSGKLAGAIADEVKKQLAVLIRRDITRKSLDKYGAVIIAKNMDKAVEISNTIAPEHLEIITKNPDEILGKIRNAGAAFVGSWTPEPLGDYSAGPNHTLPTGGTARFSSPLGTYDFIKKTSLLRFDEKGFMKLADTVELLADSEGLEAHGNTIRVRKSRIKSSEKRQAARKEK